MGGNIAMSRDLWLTRLLFSSGERRKLGLLLLLRREMSDYGVCFFREIFFKLMLPRKLFQIAAACPLMLLLDV